MKLLNPADKSNSISSYTILLVLFVVVVVVVAGDVTNVPYDLELFLCARELGKFAISL